MRGDARRRPTPRPREAPLSASAEGLAPEQIARFDEEGYLVLRGAVAPALVALLDRTTARVLEAMLASPPDAELAKEAFAIAVGDARFVTRVNHLHRYCAGASLALLGSPEVLEAAASLCEGELVATYESLVVRNGGDGEPILWHQDMVHSRASRIVAWSLYLDRALPGDAVRLLPRSQGERQDLAAVEKGSSPLLDHVVDLDMEPGDVLLQDVMAVHSTPPMQRAGRRRTVTFEFRSLEEARRAPGLSEAWLEQRRALLDLARAVSARAKDLTEPPELEADEQRLIVDTYALPYSMDPANVFVRVPGA